MLRERAPVLFELVAACCACAIFAFTPQPTPTPTPHAIAKLDPREIELSRAIERGLASERSATERFEALCAARMLDAELGGARERELDEQIALVAFAAADGYVVQSDYAAAEAARAIASRYKLPVR
jgi:hypothetical protein